MGSRRPTGCPRSLVLLLLVLLPALALGQGGGRRAYTFLDLPVSPRLTGLGGKAPALFRAVDPGLAVFNPALADAEIHNRLELGASLYFADIVFNHAAYFRATPRVGTYGLGVRQVWYGRFDGRTPTGAPDGSFTAYDMALSAYYSRSLLPGLRAGLSVNPILSRIESYNSLALTADLGLLYSHADGVVQTGLVVRNLGGTLIPYHKSYTAAPVDVTLGWSFTLQHAPLRFLLTLQHLENINYRYIREEAHSSSYMVVDPNREEPKWWQQLLQELVAHPVLGVEIAPMRYFYLQLGYNAHRAQEMALKGHYAFEGLSYGLGVNIQRFSLNFARSHYHAHGATNHLSVSLRFGRTEPAAVRERPIWGRVEPVPSRADGGQEAREEVEETTGEVVEVPREAEVEEPDEVQHGVPEMPEEAEGPSAENEPENE
ncbi:MAG: hypothetical protein CSA07_02895 [Bacteroidia bacterium]|nr:MAG: hypothetical protein CSA07_02895 [Bacteroidia bacterium]